MNRERLNHQIEILRAVAAQALPFDMDSWVGGDGEACGTAACAFGYACLDPAFQAEGLKLTFWHRYHNPESREPRTIILTTIEDYNATRQIAGLYDVAYQGHGGFSAAATFYDISLDAAEYLFDPGCYRDEDGEMRNGVMPDEVIGRIERVMDGRFGSLDEAGVIDTP